MTDTADSITGSEPGVEQLLEDHASRIARATSDLILLSTGPDSTRLTARVGHMLDAVQILTRTISNPLINTRLQLVASDYWMSRSMFEIAGMTTDSVWLMARAIETTNPEQACWLRAQARYNSAQIRLQRSEYEDAEIDFESAIDEALRLSLDQSETTSQMPVHELLSISLLRLSETLIHSGKHEEALATLSLYATAVANSNLSETLIKRLAPRARAVEWLALTHIDLAEHPLTYTYKRSPKTGKPTVSGARTREENEEINTAMAANLGTITGVLPLSPFVAPLGERPVYPKLTDALAAVNQPHLQPPRQHGHGSTQLGSSQPTDAKA